MPRSLLFTPSSSASGDLSSSTSSSSSTSNSTAPTSVSSSPPSFKMAAPPHTITSTSPSVHPTVQLESKYISDSMAARLTICLLGHVLFLKSQVPFPIMQLGRMPGSNETNSRAAKKRTELLTAVDTLTSHLHTTFTALSTALARTSSHKQSTPDLGAGSEVKTANVHVMIVLGPSAGAPRARVLLALEGLEVKIWGMRDDEEGRDTTRSRDERDHDEENDAAEEAERSYRDSRLERSPLSSRAPSPAPSSISSTSQEDQTDADSESGSESEPTSDFDSEGVEDEVYVPPPPREEEQVLRAAERLMSRTLAMACAEEVQGQGFATELAPTQTHMLLRAPRRFEHPCWIARMNLGTGLDAALDGFEKERKGTVEEQGKKKKVWGKGARVEGVRVVCRNGEVESAVNVKTGFEGGDDEDDEDEEDEGIEDDEGDEEDEMIWWSWDGKLVGFADW